MREPQGVASLALGYVLHWAFSPPLLNPKLEILILYFSDLRTHLRAPNDLFAKVVTFAVEVYTPPRQK